MLKKFKHMSNWRLGKISNFIIITILAAVISVMLGVAATYLITPHLSLPTAKNGNQPAQVSPKNNSPLDFSVPEKTETTAGDKPQQSNIPDNSASPPASGKTYLGHLSYAVAPESNLMMVGSYGLGEYQRFEYLDKEAGKALMNLIYAAREEGVWLIPISAFRDLDRQKKLFDNQVKKLGSETEAAKLSAPPGYSEHHTGLAIDLGDGMNRQDDLAVEFEKTAAFKWLEKMAPKFGFEMSFTFNNPQGVSYEPWHWRFVGSEAAKSIFSRAIR